MTAKTCRNCGSSEKYSKEVVVGGTHCRVLLAIGPLVFGPLAAFEIQLVVVAAWWIGLYQSVGYPR